MNYRKLTILILFCLSACTARVPQSVQQGGGARAETLEFDYEAGLHEAMARYGIAKDSAETINLGEARRYVGKLRSPVNGGQVMSQFGRRWLSFHEGLDIAAPEGTPIYAAHSGEVVFSGASMRGYGNMVVIKGPGLMTVYAHNKRNIVEVGDTVQAGEKLALVGMTGNASGPHLHFETRIRGKDGKSVAIDPMTFRGR
jgi:murein DD-endopeptidase MepM/ murein hydrolase activator NlpD